MGYKREELNYKEFGVIHIAKTTVKEKEKGATKVTLCGRKILAEGLKDKFGDGWEKETSTEKKPLCKDCLAREKRIMTAVRRIQDKQNYRITINRAIAKGEAKLIHSHLTKRANAEEMKKLIRKHKADFLTVRPKDKNGFYEEEFWKLKDKKLGKIAKEIL